MGRVPHSLKQAASPKRAARSERRNRKPGKSKLGSSSFQRRLIIEPLETRTLLTAISWINPGSGNWDVAANWNTDTVPGPADDVTISPTSAATITIQSGDAESVNSLTTGSNSTLAITGGSLTAGEIRPWAAAWP